MKMVSKGAAVAICFLAAVITLAILGGIYYYKSEKIYENAVKVPFYQKGGNVSSPLPSTFDLTDYTNIGNVPYLQSNATDIWGGGNAISVSQYFLVSAPCAQGTQCSNCYYGIIMTQDGVFIIQSPDQINAINVASIFISDKTQVSTDAFFAIKFNGALTVQDNDGPGSTTYTEKWTSDPGPNGTGLNDSQTFNTNYKFLEGLSQGQNAYLFIDPTNNGNPLVAGGTSYATIGTLTPLLLSSFTLPVCTVPSN